MRQQDLPIVETYAQALLHAARTRDCVEQTYQEALVLAKVLAQFPSGSTLMERPAIEKEAKKSFIRRVFKERLSPLMFHLPMLLLDHHRGGQWVGVLEYFIALVEKEKGIVRAEVQTAKSLDSGQMDLLKARLERFTGKQLRIKYLVRPDLLGGVLFRYEDILVDTTVRSGLEAISRRLEAIKVA